MFLLKTVKPEEAAGKVAEAYKVFPKEVGIPTPLQLMSASPGLLERQTGVIGYYMSHKKLTFPLLAAIRYLAALKTGHAFCTEFNGGMLLQMGMSASDLADLKSDPKTSNLEPEEAAMVAFVAKALDDPASVTKADIEALRGQGFEDADIFDALAHGANMYAGSVLFKAFVREDG
jgi:alkylhydroperoxidase family enzyme